jgi:DNA-binding NtrC family response regulator
MAGDVHITVRRTPERRAPTGRLRLHVIGEQSLQTYPLPASGEVTIGRAEDADIRLDDSQVSRRHATLVMGEPLKLRDLGSVNGTHIGDRRVAPEAPAEVRVGDVIEVGSTMLIVQQGGAAERPRHLWSHGYFEGRLEDECARAERAGGRFAIVRFHVEAEAAVVEQLLARALRPGDLVAAYGPGEYEILLADTAADEAEARTRQLTDELHQAGVRGRAGVAAYPRDGSTAEMLLARACAAVRPPNLDGGVAPNRPVMVHDGAMQRLHRLVERVAQGTISVLILGETGVGKEVLAETVHRLSPRAERPFLRLNCAALSESLLESELFGHERGAFTGALAAKPGLLETADGGTVFLDEVGEIPLAVQVKLLRVLEERRVTRVGSVKSRAIDVRFVAATNRDLEAEVERGLFRRDLYFRLNGIALTIPPLRERVGEIAQLALGFCAEAARSAGQPRAPELTPPALALLERYSWPGNIRELRNLIERAVLLSGGAPIALGHLPVEKMGATLAPAPLSPFGEEVTAPARPSGLRGEIAVLERQRILDALERCAGNQTQAAKLLGVSRRTLVSRLAEYGLPRPRKQNR